MTARIGAIIRSVLYLISLVIVAFTVRNYIINGSDSIKALTVLSLCTFTLFQTLLEELIFRFIPLCVYNQITKRLVKNKTQVKTLKLIFIIAPSLLFSLLHIKNSEVLNNPNGYLVLIIYFIAGVYYMGLTISENSIYSAWSVHYINNIFAFAIVSSLSSSSPFNALYVCIIKEDNILFMLSSLLFSIVFTEITYRLITKMLRKHYLSASKHHFSISKNHFSIRSK